MRFIAAVCTVILAAAVSAGAEDGPFRCTVTGGKVSGDLYRHFAPPSTAGMPLQRAGGFGLVDLRNDTWYGRTGIQIVGGDPSGKSATAAFGAHTVSFKGVRFGLGLRYNGIVEHQRLFADQYASGGLAHQRHFFAAGPEFGIGRYNRNYLRIGYFAGAVHARFDADLYVHGQLINNVDTNGLNWTVSQLRILEVHGRAQRSFGRHTLVADAAARRLTLRPMDNYSNLAQYLPDKHLVLEARAAYTSPLKIGAYMGIVRTDDPRGSSFLNDTFSFGMLFKY